MGTNHSDLKFTHNCPVEKASPLKDQIMSSSLLRLEGGMTNTETTTMQLARLVTLPPMKTPTPITAITFKEIHMMSMTNTNDSLEGLAKTLLKMSRRIIISGH